MIRRVVRGIGENSEVSGKSRLLRHGRGVAEEEAITEYCWVQLVSGMSGPNDFNSRSSIGSGVLRVGQSFAASWAWSYPRAHTSHLPVAECLCALLRLA